MYLNRYYFTPEKRKTAYYDTRYVSDACVPKVKNNDYTFN